MRNSPDGLFNDRDLFVAEPNVGLATGCRVDYRGWLLRALCWDGILPALICGIPRLALALGADHSTTEVLSVLGPLLAFFARMDAGLRWVSTNHCGPILRFCQYVVFFHAALLLVCIDTLMILAVEMNHGRWFTNKTDLAVWLAFFGMYGIAMLFVLYPGRNVKCEIQSGLNRDYQQMR